MITAIFLCTIFGSSLATPLTTVWLSPISPVAPLTHQYQSQDGSGAYHYAYTGPHHAKTETSLNGVTQGGYSYIDANGILQTVAYTADAQNGFRVSASNLPQQPREDQNPVSDTPEVAAAKKDHLEEFKRVELEINQNPTSWQDRRVLPYKNDQPILSFSNVVQQEADNHLDSQKSQTQQELQNPFLLTKAEAEKIDIPKPDPSLFTYSQSGIFQKDAQKLHIGQVPVSNIASLPVHRPIALPSSYVLPILPYRLLHSSLHHTQDSLGQYDYSYTGDSSAKTESRSLDGTTRGAYSYIDANGLLQQVHYIADHNGFRVAATNLPEA
ncbi:uncharacterized protein LOC107272032 [Cephus cinctus]|uniref:Uncharacterized protein LOC107272032 n=1 Tax=Cephus cinctus TaxID=211228 RepID=A0AAJ7FR67_CEPCN|nr:uncharacterized protein LOC107272032 [Cephus cinctus]